MSLYERQGTIIPIRTPSFSSMSKPHVAEYVSS
jgi:hypothetical protein